jgi:hypothetical protein
LPIGWAIAVSLISGGVTSFLSWRAGASLIEGIIIVFLVEIVVGIISLDRLLRAKPTERIEHIAPETKILKRAREMRGRSDRSLHCIWCSMEYDNNLQDYFEGFRGLKPTVYRLINVRRRPSDVADHLGLFINEIRAGKYVITSTHHEAFEFLIGDKKEVLLLVPYATQYGISEAMYSVDVDFAHAVFRTYESLENDGSKLVIPVQADDNEAKRIIAEWIRNEAQ